MNAITSAKTLLPARPDSATNTSDRTTLGRMIRPQIVVGAIVTLLFFGVFGGWAALAPLVSGATAPGVVSPDSSRRAVQHLEGGIIRSIDVREGQTVSAGDLLMTLESTRAAATFSAREKQWLRLLAQRARLDAQASDLPEMVLPPELELASAAGLDDFIASQTSLFETRRATLNQQAEIQERQVEQLRREIESINAQNEALLTQYALIGEEIEDKESLLERQLINKSEVLALQRQRASIGGTMSSNQARIAQINQSIEETRLNLLQAEEAFRDRVAAEASEVNNQIATIEEDMIASGDVLRRTEVISPVDGTVLNIRNQTIGGVIRPGDEILDIVPVNDQLIVFARLSPRDINLVHPGLEAKVHLVPFQNRNALPLIGEVTQVAADSTFDEATRETFFEVRVLVSNDELAKHEGMFLAPGMPAEVIIVTGERTMLQYLFDPVVRTLRSAFVYD